MTNTSIVSRSSASRCASAPAVMPILFSILENEAVSQYFAVIERGTFTRTAGAGFTFGGGAGGGTWVVLCALACALPALLDIFLSVISSAVYIKIMIVHPPCVSNEPLRIGMDQTSLNHIVN